MPYVPPWLQATDVLGAISSGANAGLSARQIGDEESNSANRLRASQDSLAMQQQQFQQELAAKQSATAAATALRKQQYDALEQYRQDQIKDQQQRIKDAEATKSAAATLQGMVSDDNQGFLKDVNDGIDPIKAYENRPKADQKTVMPIIMAALKSKHSTTKEPTFSGPIVEGEANSMRVNNLPINSPIVNSLLGTNELSKVVGTNYVSPSSILRQQPDAAFTPLPSSGSVVPSPDAPDAMAAFASGSTTPTFTKGQKVKQGGKIYQFDGTDWNEVNE